jgi:excisionase family DNA binding protein
MNKLLYRPKEAAQMPGIGRDKLYDLMRCGRLRSVKDGRAPFITASALAEYVAMLESEARRAAGSSRAVDQRIEHLVHSIGTRGDHRT